MPPVETVRRSTCTMSRSCHSALTARHEPSFSASFSSSRPPGRNSRRAASRNGGHVVARDQAQHVGDDDAVERRRPFGGERFDRDGAELRVRVLAYGLVGPLDLADVGVDADDAALGMAVQQQRGQHAVAAADVEDVFARGLRGDGLERRELKPRATEPAFFRGQRVEYLETRVGHRAYY